MVGSLFPCGNLSVFCIVARSGAGMSGQMSLYLMSVGECMKRLLIIFIQFYRKFISPMKRFPACKYVPTCSEYALQALEKYGFWRGSWLAVKRILRCNPFSRGGYDPVP